jgi:hypothetical protein
LNQITLLVLLIVTSLFLPVTAIMYASGSPQNSDESDSGSMEGDDASDDGSMDDASDDESMDDESDTWSMEKSNNALASGSMEGDDASDDESMDDESDTWSMEKSNNALTPEPTGGTDDGLSPLTSGPTGGTDDGLSPLTSGPTGGTDDGLSPLTSGPTGTTNGLSPLTSGPTGTTNGLSPLTSGFRIEGNNTRIILNETAANFANDILAVHNQERAAVSVPPLTWSDKLAADAKTWADHLAATGVYAHDVAHLGNLSEGENLEWIETGPATGPEPLPPAKDIIAGWINEKKYYQQWVTKSLPSTANWTGWSPGHYNQMVWRDTTAVGCATASALQGSIHNLYLVCRYSPPGNIIGQTPF